MNTRDQFGNYLLLKKLAEDALGETFRAGKIGRQTLERVVLLRVLNGAGFDAERIARALQARSSLAQALKSPTIGQATDVGQVRGVPYIAYDYSSGRSLSQLLEQAGRRNSPLPLDHALLVAERVALALAVAHETRFGDERVLHGFVAPQLVQVTNEGELKLLGFEASTGLRESAPHPNVKQAVGRYLAPEALAGQPPSKADDVYSVAALLLEMITGQAAASPGTAVDQAQVAADGTPLPAELGALLKRSFAPRDQRLPDIVTWHKSVAKLMADNGWAATTFNLAFFLHNLFRDEIERESRELESEKSQASTMVAAVTARAPEPAPAASAAPSPIRTSGPVREDSSVLRDEYGLPAKKSGPNMALIGGAAAVVVLGVAGFLLFGRGGGDAPAPQPQPQAPPVAAEAAPAPAGLTPEQIQEMIAQALAEQKKQIEAGQKTSGEQIRALQEQLDNANAQRARATSPPPSVAIASPPPSAAPATAPATSPAAQTAAEPVSTSTAPTPSATTPSTAAPQTASPSAAAPQTTAPAPATAAPTPAAQRPVAAATTPAPRAAATVKEGDLITMGAGVTPPRVTRQPPLAYPQVARRLRKEANISVRVLVDENGRVIDVDAGNSNAGFGLDEAAISHAKNCQWEPARKDGVKVKMWTDLRVVFKL